MPTLGASTRRTTTAGLGRFVCPRETWADGGDTPGTALLAGWIATR